MIKINDNFVTINETNYEYGTGNSHHLDDIYHKYSDICRIVFLKEKNILSIELPNKFILQICSVDDDNYIISVTYTTVGYFRFLKYRKFNADSDKNKLFKLYHFISIIDVYDFIDDFITDDKILIDQLSKIENISIDKTFISYKENVIFDIKNNFLLNFSFGNFSTSIRLSNEDMPYIKNILGIFYSKYIYVTINNDKLVNKMLLPYNGTYHDIITFNLDDANMDIIPYRRY